MTTIDPNLIPALRRQADQVRNLKVTFTPTTLMLLDSAAAALETQQAQIEQLTIALQAETKLVREAQGDARYWHREAIRRNLNERGRP